MSNVEELELVFPTKEYQKQFEEYVQEFVDNGEYRIPAFGEVDRFKNYDEWLEKIKKDLSEKTVEANRVPATSYLTIRKSDGRIVGNVQIRHRLNNNLLNYGGHIGDSVRPSERRKGYATKQIDLALKKCKELGIGNVLMDCDKNNIGSAKSIMNNGGILENECEFDGSIVQRYWISLKKRYADWIKTDENIIKYETKIKSVKNEDFTGDIYLHNFIKVKKPFILSKGLCIRDTDYKWLEFYDYNSKILLTAIFDEKNNIVEWYFDIARKIGKDSNGSYQDDLYLDVVVTKSKEIILLDEDELESAYNRLEVNQKDYEMAYNEAKNLMKKLENNIESLEKFTKKYLSLVAE